MSAITVRRVLAGSAVALSAALATSAAGQNVVAFDSGLPGLGSPAAGRTGLPVPTSPVPFGVTFAAPASNISGIGFSLFVGFFAGDGGVAPFSVSLYGAVPAFGASPTPLASATRVVELPGETSPRAFADFFFATPVGVTPGAMYYAEIQQLAPAPLAGTLVSSGVREYAGDNYQTRFLPPNPSPDAALRIYTNPSFAAIPEPSTYALLAAGLGGVGAVARRRRVATRA
jgi:hypothetical protein